MKKFPTQIQAWFLDNDLSKSAQYQTNWSLDISLVGCEHALICARMYFIGIRSKKFYEHFFNKDNIASTYSRFFPNWPLKKKPTFIHYTSKLSKWCRQCNEHYTFIQDYLDILLCEYEYRHKKPHEMRKVYDWLCSSAPDLSIPNANLKSINIPWKPLKARYRRKDIIEGYRLQFMACFKDDDAFNAYNGTMRDIPDFVVKHFKLDIAGVE